MKIDTSTPVILLGGRGNTLSIARNLGRLGVSIRVSGATGCIGMNSRYCCESFPVGSDQSTHEFWRDLLLSSRRDLDGHIVFALCDDSVEFLLDHHEALRERYILDDFVPQLRRDMLDKKRTLELAEQAGIPVPRSWMADDLEDLEKIRDELRFPAMVKPIHSHLFAPIMGCKLFIIEDSFDEVVEKVKLARQHDLQVMVVEMIPGPDDLLCSYFTYIDASGHSLFHYTKRVLRRFPVNRGGACYHITEWIPETAELGRRFFDAIGWRGMANIEFKRDVRDGKLKVIEVNPRFTAAHRLIVESGAPIDIMVYCSLTGQEVPTFESYMQDLRMWNPPRDFMAFRELNKRGKLSLSNWLHSVFFYKKILPVFSLSDPIPSFIEAKSTAGLAGRWLGFSGRD